jgi:arylsulfatase A-like enzyme
MTLSIYFKKVMSFLLTAFFPLLLFAQKKQVQPNIIFLLVDDMGYADLGCFGSSFYETPNIDALAKQGMKFMNTYTAASICSPTRGSIMTGRYPVRTGVTDWIPGQKVNNTKLIQPKTALLLADKEVTFAEILKKQGYATFYAGKWHLGDKSTSDPLTQGFDEYYSAKELRQSKSALTSDSITKNAEAFIIRKAKEKKPFMAFVSYYDVHTPMYDYPDFIDHYKQKQSALPSGTKKINEHNGVTRSRQDDPQYASLVAAVDKSVGNITKLLNSLGIDKNTVVIFTSDNGGLATSGKGGPTSNLPYRSGKGWLYEGGIRVPLIISQPGTIKAGSICAIPTMSTDFYPTMLQLAGSALRPDLHKDGLSLVPLIQQKRGLDRTDFFWHYPHYHGSTWTPGAAVRSGDWKLIAFFETGTYELYNLKTDPYEQQDKAAERKDIVETLKVKLSKWQQETGAKMPAPNTAYDPAIKEKKGKKNEEEL